MFPFPSQLRVEPTPYQEVDGYCKVFQKLRVMFIVCKTTISRMLGITKFLIVRTTDCSLSHLDTFIPFPTHSVTFKTRDMACQVDDDVQSALYPGRSPAMLPTLSPFSNLRNGSGLKMQWRRWTGGETRGPSKSSNDDPAVSCAVPFLVHTLAFGNP